MESTLEERVAELEAQNLNLIRVVSRLAAHTATLSMQSSRFAMHLSANQLDKADAALDRQYEVAHEMLKLLEVFSDGD